MSRAWASRQQSVTTTEEMESDTHGQRWSAWFLWKEGASTADIHRRLQGVCGDHAPGKRTVYYWVTAFKNGRQSADDRPRFGHPPTAVTAVNIKRVKDLSGTNNLRSWRCLCTMVHSWQRPMPRAVSFWVNDKRRF